MMNSVNIDTDYLSYLAQWIESGKPLNGKHLRKARALMMKYAGQLVKIANTQQQNTISFGACYK